jgi:hypothetical protein
MYALSINLSTQTGYSDIWNCLVTDLANSMTFLMRPCMVSYGTVTNGGLMCEYYCNKSASRIVENLGM